jgi:hypothetical protein
MGGIPAAISSSPAWSHLPQHILPKDPRAGKRRVMRPDTRWLALRWQAYHGACRRQRKRPAWHTRKAAAAGQRSSTSGQTACSPRHLLASVSYTPERATRSKVGAASSLSQVVVRSVLSDLGTTVHQGALASSHGAGDGYSLGCRTLGKGFRDLAGSVGTNH